MPVHYSDLRDVRDWKTEVDRAQSLHEVTPSGTAGQKSVHPEVACPQFSNGSDQANNELRSPNCSITTSTTVRRRTKPDKWGVLLPLTVSAAS